MEEEIKQNEEMNNVEETQDNGVESKETPETNAAETNVTETKTEPEVDVEEAKNKVVKQINYSAALKEKNRKIQELKQRLRELEAKQETQPVAEEEETFDLFEEDKDKKIKELESKIARIEEEFAKRKEQEKLQQARTQLDAEISRLKQAYPDFDENRVLAELIRRKGEYATLKDIELVYKALKAEEILKQQAVKTAVTEGGSAGKATPEKKFKTYEDVVKEFLGE